MKANARVVEARWQEIEDHTGAAIAELAQGGLVHAGSAMETVVKDCLALHWARSRAVRDVSERAFEKQRQASKAAYAHRPDLLDRGFREVTGGLYPAGPEAREIANERLHVGPEEIRSGEHFARRVVELRARSDGPIRGTACRCTTAQKMRRTC